MRVALCLSLCLAAPAAHASPSDAAAIGVAPVGIIFAVGAIGGLGTTLMLTFEEGSIHPALRNISLACAGINVLAGGTGILVAAIEDEDEYDLPVYIVGGALLSLGLTGGILALTTDTYEVRDNHGQGLMIGPTDGGVAAMWTGRF